METHITFMEKPSCINKLKSLADSLIDQDVDLKECMSKVKKTLHDESLTSEEIITKLKDICNTYGK